ncbi:MAG TPA: M81 family metallopeptidase [Chloroflexota bacterium]|nr:M81 family metallopeptidase [Chloroflexota bacterium]
MAGPPVPRVAVGGFAHETNTFHPSPTALAAFQRPPAVWVEREELLEAFSNTRSVIGGFLDVAREQSWTVIPTFFADHPPTTGTLTAEAFDAIRARLVSSIGDARPDAALLFLHGACVADGVDDPEAVVLAELRAALGPAVPIVVVHDLHANIGLGWLEHATAIVGYKTAPHTDFYERGREGATLLGRILRREVRPVMAARKPPILIKAGLMSMTDAPLALIKPTMFWVMQRAHEIERDPRILNVTVAAGFGDADTPVAGLTTLVTADGDRALAEDRAAELAELAWRLRRGLLTDLVLTPVDTAVQRALHTPGTVILADQGNNTAGGSPGDGTAILSALKDAGWPDAALFIRDEDAVDAAWKTGVGCEIEVAVGGKHEPSNGDPVLIRGEVRLLTEGVARGVTGTPAQLGRTAVVRCGASGGPVGQTDLVLTQYPTSQTDPHYFRVVGIEPRERKIVVVQSAHLFRAAFEVRERIPSAIVEVDTPGITSPNASRFTYHRVRRPIFPLDDFEWQQ